MGFNQIENVYLKIKCLNLNDKDRIRGDCVDKKNINFNALLCSQ